MSICKECDNCYVSSITGDMCAVYGREHNTSNVTECKRFEEADISDPFAAYYDRKTQLENQAAPEYY